MAAHFDRCHQAGDTESVTDGGPQICCSSRSQALTSVGVAFSEGSRGCTLLGTADQPFNVNDNLQLTAKRHRRDRINDEYHYLLR